MVDFPFMNHLQQVPQVEMDPDAIGKTLQILLEGSGDGLIIADRLGRVTYFNPTAERLTENRDGIAVGRKVNEIFSLRRVAVDGEIAPSMEHTIDLGLPNCRFAAAVLRTASGTEYRVDGKVVGIPLPNGGASTIIFLRDISALMRAERGLVLGATHDLLTGLMNRSEFLRRLDKLIAQRSDCAQHIFLHLDLDEFKLVNAIGGRRAGDELLRRVSRVLQNNIRDSDLVGRFGDDEFGVALTNCGVIDGCRIAEQIRHAIYELKFVWDGVSFKTSASIGIVYLDTEGHNADQCMQNANVACEFAKELGRNDVYLLQGDDVKLKHHVAQVAALSSAYTAFEFDRFLLYAQPIVPLGESAGELPHMEILLRMLDGCGDIVLPGTFLPAAERYNQMSSIDRWVVTRTFATITRLRISEDYIFAVNLSSQSIGRSDFLQFMLESIDRFGINPKNLCFEISAAPAFANFSRSEEFIAMLSKRGCRFAMNDFRDGMSSLVNLERPTIDYLRIDGGFVHNLANNPLNRVMTSAIQSMASAANIKTIATSVETDSDVHILKAIGVDLVQGYLVAQPMPIEELCQLDFTQLDVGQDRPDAEAGDDRLLK